MSIPKTEKIWCNGKFIAWDDAKIHVLSHVVSYGSAVFEGIRAYHTDQGPAVFRLLAGHGSLCVHDSEAMVEAIFSGIRPPGYQRSSKTKALKPHGRGSTEL